MTSGQIDAVIKKFVSGPLAANCYLVYGKSSKKGILIDPGDHDTEIVRYIRDHGIDVCYSVNTHGHADHIFACAEFGYPVLIHELDESYLGDTEKNLSGWMNQSVKPVKAERLLRDGDVLAVGGLRFEIIHTPGHTPGSVSIRLGDTLFSGDTLFFGGIGRTDIPGGDHETLIRSIKEKLMKLPDDTKVLPGHGPETTIGRERNNNPFL